MSFDSPWLLLCLLLVPLALVGYWLLERQRTHRAEAWSSGALMPNMVPTSPGRRRYVPLALFMVALILLLAGFARPQANINVPREGATVIITLDVSGSMEAKDVAPGPTTRLLAARTAITEFVDDLPERYRVSLVTYGNRGTVRVPPTNDRDRLLAALPLKARAEGTVLASGIQQATRVAQLTIDRNAPPAQRRPAAVVLLLGDGGNSGQTDPMEAAERAQKLGVPIYTVALGTEGPLAQVTQPIQGSPGNVEVTQVPVDPAVLQDIAQTTGAKFVEATTAEQLKAVTQEIPSRFVNDKKKREITVAVAAAAVVFLIAGALLSGLWFRRLV